MLLTELGLDGIPEAEALLRAAFKSDRGYSARLRRLLSLGPGQWLAAREEGRILGMGGFTLYGRVAYVGCVAVLPERQGLGIARAVMEGLLERAREKAVSTILLDASDSGKPLYERLGFVAEDSVGLWRRGAGNGKPDEADFPPFRGPGIRTAIVSSPLQGPAGRALAAEIADLDRSLWGADRSALLASYAADSTLRVAEARGEDGALVGYGIIQDSEETLGPWIARESAAAWAMAEALLGPGAPEPRPSMVYVPGANQEGLAIMQALGFELAKTQLHMRLGPQLSRDRRLRVFSQAGFSLG